MMFHDSATISIQEDETQGAVGQLNPHGKTPQHSPRQTKEILCMKDPPPGLPDSVSLTWDLLRPKPGRLFYSKTKMFGWFGGFQHQGSPTDP